MLDLERELAEKAGGPRNNETWAKSKQGAPLSKKAAKAKARAGV